MEDEESWTLNKGQLDLLRCVLFSVYTKEKGSTIRANATPSEIFVYTPHIDAKEDLSDWLNAFTTVHLEQMEIDIGCTLLLIAYTCGRKTFFFP